LAIRADSGDPAAVKEAINQVLARFGRLDIVVVNAGILMRGTIDAFGLDDFDKMVAINRASSLRFISRLRIFRTVAG